MNNHQTPFDRFLDNVLVPLIAALALFAFVATIGR